MNERIKELYKQTSKQDCFPQDGEEVYMSAGDLEKFAELIVQECVNICKTGGVSNSDYNTGRLHCVYDIKQHFGIEK